MGCGASTPAPAKAQDPGDVPVKPAYKAATPSTPTKSAPTPIKDKSGKVDMKALFVQFDADGDGKLDIYEIARAFRALGLEKRSGEKSDMDKAMFKSFDTNVCPLRCPPPSHAVTATIARAA